MGVVVSLTTHLLFVGESTHVDLGVITEVSLPSYPALPPEASSHSATIPGVSPHPEEQLSQTSPVDLGPERTEGEVRINCKITHDLI